MRKTVVASILVSCVAGAIAVAHFRGRHPGYVTRLSKDDFELSGATSVEDEAKHGFRPRPDVKPWPLVLPIDWRADPFHDDNWQFQLHAWRMNDPFLKEYFETKNVKLLESALGYAMDWHRFHYRDHQQAKFTWYDMATGLRAMQLALFLDRVYAGELRVDADTTQGLEEMAREHARRLQSSDFVPMNNHGFFEMLGLDYLCAVLADDSGCSGGRAFAAKKFAEILRASYTSEGVHREHSPGYHIFVTKTLERLAVRRWRDAAKVMDEAHAIMSWLVFPDGSVARIGDTEGKETVAPVTVATPECLSPGRCYAMRDLSASGYAVVRSLPSVDAGSACMLFFAGMAYGTTHKHADDLGFELFENGRFVFVDSGKYSYKEDKMRGYVTSGVAHNTVSLVGNAVGANTAKPVGSELEAVRRDDTGFLLRGRVERKGLFVQARTITYDPGRLLVVRDELSSAERRSYVSSLHLAPGLTAAVDTRGFAVDLGSNHSLRADVDERDCRVESATGQKEPLLGWVTVSYGQMAAATTVRAICDGNERTITWRVRFDAAPSN